MEWSRYEASMLTLPFGNVLRQDKILLNALRCPSLGSIMNLIIAEVAFSISIAMISQSRMQVSKSSINTEIKQGISARLQGKTSSSYSRKDKCF
jgi:hypothetical protein